MVKVVALRKYLHRSSKSDKIDALTLAKMPFIDPEQLEEIYLPPAKIYAIEWLAHQRKRLESEIGSRKKKSALSWMVISWGCDKPFQIPGLPMPELSFVLA